MVTGCIPPDNFFQFKVEDICSVYKLAVERAKHGELTFSLDEMPGIQALERKMPEFLADPNHRLIIHFTPKHCSWLNQIEIWFSILMRKLLRQGNFISKSDLKQRILDFVEYFNRTMAKPFKWTYKGKPLAA